MAKILLLETATEVCAAAIAVDGKVVALAEVADTHSHTALLTLQIEACARQSGIPLSGLDAVAVSRGPGAYTSLRVGASVAKGICYALGKPLLAVDTLQALAFASREACEYDASTLFVPMLDARRQEVWLAVYDAMLQVLLPAQPFIFENNLFENTINVLDMNLSGRMFVLSGNGCVKAKNVIFAERTVLCGINKCSAVWMAPLAEQIFQQNDCQDIAYFEPFYMKPPNITTPNKVW